ncbi:MAG: FliM/FliN family flagellar motor switch protein [Gammaproteobacteria bacterium]
MSEFQVLSTEEVEELLKATDGSGNDLSVLLANGGNNNEQVKNEHLLNNLVEALRLHSEKLLSSFLRKKIAIKSNPFNASQLNTCLNEITPQHVYAVFRASPKEKCGLIIIDMMLLHQAINLLFGGKIDATETVITHPGQIGLLISENIAQIFAAAFVKATNEYETIECEVLKIDILPNLPTNYALDDSVRTLELPVMLDELQTSVKYIFSDCLLNGLMPAGDAQLNPLHDKTIWHDQIKSQVVDSYVNVSIALTEINMSVKDFMALKQDDVIPVADPTQVYVCLNNTKLFKATAGQANSKLVAKITSKL